MSGKVRKNPYSIDVFLPPYYGIPEGNPQHRHKTEYEWFYCRSGSGMQLVGDWRREVNPGELLLIPPALPHVFCGDRNGGCHADVLFLDAAYLEGDDQASTEARLLLRFLHDHVVERGYRLELPPAEARRGGALIHRLTAELAQPRFGGALKTRVIIGELLALALRLPSPPCFRPTPVPSRKNEKIERLLYMLDQHFSKPMSVADALAFCGMKRSTFHIHFRAVTGMTFADYLTALRLRAAEEMIRLGIPPGDTARRCGFAHRSNYYYCRRKNRDS